MRIDEKIKAAFDPYFNAPIEAWKSFAELGEVVTAAKDQTIKKKWGNGKISKFPVKRKWWRIIMEQ